MTHKVAGYDVQFPRQPYGVQLSFMSKVLNTVEKRENALLEAPTGSGKTLSLLCSALSWQRRLKEEGYSEAWQGRQLPDEPASGKALAVTPSPALPTPAPVPSPPKVQDSCTASASALASEQPTASTEGEQTPQQQQHAGDAQRLPRVFYATRTHSQIAQVVKELKRAGYLPRMAILGSRTHYCCHATVSKKKFVDEECDKLLEDGACKYFTNVQKLYGMQTSSALQVHDIEDLCRVGRQMKACAYFASRKFAEEAELVFTPYAYLLDPVIRAAMKVDIKHAVLIFDEAHNIEDICREAASAELEQRTLQDAKAALDQMVLVSSSTELYGPLADGLGRVIDWLSSRMERPDVRQQQGHTQRYECVWSGMQARAELDGAGLSPERVELMHDLCERVRRMEAEGQNGGPQAPAEPLAEPDQEPSPAPAEGSKGPKAGGLALGVLSRLLTILRLLYTADAGDYRVAVQRWFRRPHDRAPRRRGRRMDGDEDDKTSGWANQLCLWSLNPAVAFRSISEQARSVILTSGTLSPLDSFASELGTEFRVRFEAPHVINARTQVWAGALGCGPDGARIVGTFEESQKAGFQDGVGGVILNVARTVPDGLLVFFPSYSLLDRLMQRWQATGMWAQLGAVKELVCEPRGTGDAFDGVMGAFYAAINAGRGAIFFAICRGKVSEGLDFTDANARGVIVVGIPFPNVKDTKVALKKKYNDAGQRDRSRALLNGDQWYSQQAYRALNQAIGRCIRHKNDYGAIVLLDRRFNSAANHKHLSRWVRASINVHEDFQTVLGTMRDFFARITASPPGGAPPPSPAGADQAPKEAAATSPAKPAVTNSGTTAGKDLSSHFASHSQPTLEAVWRKPAGAQLRAPPRPSPRPARVLDAPAAVTAPAEHAGSGTDKLAVPPVQPGEVPRTQTHGRGAEGADETAWARSGTASAPSQQLLASATDAALQHSHGGTPVRHQAWQNSGGEGAMPPPPPQRQLGPATSVNAAQRLLGRSQALRRGGPGVRASPLCSSSSSSSGTSQPWASPTGGSMGSPAGSMFPAPHQPQQQQQQQAQQQSRLRGQVHHPASPAGASHQRAPLAPQNVSPAHERWGPGSGCAASGMQQGRTLPASMRPARTSSPWQSSTSQSQGGCVRSPQSNAPMSAMQLVDAQTSPQGAPAGQHSNAPTPPPHGQAGQRTAHGQRSSPPQHGTGSPACGGQPGSSAFGFLLHAGVMPVWLQWDIEKATSALRGMQGQAGWADAELPAKAREVVFECFEHFRELAEESTSLEHMADCWACAPPLGLQAVLAVFRRLPCPALPGLPADMAPRLLESIAALPLLAAIQASGLGMEAAYASVGQSEGPADPRSPLPAACQDRMQMEACPASVPQCAEPDSGAAPAMRGMGSGSAQKRGLAALQPLAAHDDSVDAKRRANTQQPKAQPAWTQASDDTDDFMI